MQDVGLTLSWDEAWVLFALLHRWEDADAVDPQLLPGEQTACGISQRRWSGS